MSFTRKRLATLFTTFIRFAEIGTFFKDFLCCLHLNSVHHNFEKIVKVLENLFKQVHQQTKNRNVNILITKSMTLTTKHFTCVIQYQVIRKIGGQCLWLSWKSGRFRHQRSAVRIQSSAKFLLNIVYCQLC